MKFSKEEILEGICTNIRNILYDFLNENGYVYLCHKYNREDGLIDLGYVDITRPGINFVDKDELLIGSKDKFKKLYIGINNNKIKLTTSLPRNFERAVCSEDFILKILDITVVNSKLSGKVFGKLEEKTELIGNKYNRNTYKIEYGNSKRLESETYFVKIPHELGKDGFIKFVVSEVQFSIPSLKGYSIPKDKTLYKGDKVKLIFDKYSEPWEIIDITYDSTSKKICRNSKNRMKDIVTIKKYGMSKKVFAKYLKKV